MTGLSAKKSLPKWVEMKNLLTLAQSPQKSLSDQADEDLAALYQKGNADAFQILLSRHERPLFNFILKSVGNRELSEEVFQEVFLRVIKHIEEYRPTSKFTTWMYTIARNYCIDFSRKQRFRHHVSLDTPTHEDAEPLLNKISSEAHSVDDVAHSNDLEAVLHKILGELNEEQREVFLLRESQGLQFDEIARITKTSINTVKSRMRYAMQAIQKKFAEHGIDRAAFEKSASSF